jgi:hypothetical protein
VSRLTIVPATFLAMILSGSGLAASPEKGEGAANSFLFYSDESGDHFGYEPVFDQNGNPIGRLVPLHGDIDGINFESGECAPGVYPSGPLAGSTCVVFGDGVEPGTFKRTHEGQTAFTDCFCTVAGQGDALIPDFPLDISFGDPVVLAQFEALKDDLDLIESFLTLKISYPNAVPKQYPGGFTKFAFQDGTGELEGLRGEGTLNFAAPFFGEPAVTFKYVIK